MLIICDCDILILIFDIENLTIGGDEMGSPNESNRLSIYHWFHFLNTAQISTHYL